MRKPSAFALLALASIALTGCSATSGSTDSSVGVGGDGMASYGTNDAVAPSDANGSKTSADQSVITTASAFLTDDDPVAAGTEIEKRVAEVGGRIDGRTVTSDQDGTTTWISLTVRVPADKLDGFLAGLDEVATVQNLNEYSQDVTLIVTDYTARISSLEASIARLQQMLRGANQTSELIEIETAISDRQAQLESLQAEMRYYSDQIDMSTVQVDVGLPESAIDPAPDDFWSGIVAGWNGLLAFLGGIVIGVGVVLPWLPLVALVGGVVWWLIRRGNAKHEAATRTPASRTTR